MSNSPFTAPLYIEIKPSLQKYLIITTPHIFALLLPAFLKGLQLFQIVFLVSAILFSLVYFIRLHCFRSLKHSVTALQQDSMNNWSLLFTRSNERKTAKLEPSSFASNSFIILNYKIDNADHFRKNCSVFITKDSISKQQFRILKAKLTLHH